jgi:aerobic C4-dicarboxylate transport protein
MACVVPDLRDVRRRRARGHRRGSPGFSLWKFLRFIRERAAARARDLVLGIGPAAPDEARWKSSAAIAPVVGLVVPTGLLVQPRRHLHLPDDGGAVRRAGDEHDLSLGEQIGLLAVLLLTSKGAAGVTGSGFIVLAATLAATARCRWRAWR